MTAPAGRKKRPKASKSLQENSCNGDKVSQVPRSVQRSLPTTAPDLEIALGQGKGMIVRGVRGLIGFGLFLIVAIILSQGYVGQVAGGFKWMLGLWG